MRNILTVLFALLMLGCATSEQGVLEPRPDLAAITPGELRVEIQSPTTDLYTVDGEESVDQLRLLTHRSGRGLPLVARGNREALDALNAAAREDGNIEADFFAVTAVHTAASAGILAFSVLAHDDPVEIITFDIAQRPGDARQQARRAHVGVLVERLTDRQPQPP